jgi:hypothetical protein
MPALTTGAGAPSRQHHVERTIILLGQALHTVDQIGDIPEIGARLQMLIDALTGDLEARTKRSVQIRSTVVPDRTEQ